jgi:hypothetical protein
MIYQAMILLSNELNKYLHDIVPEDDEPVILGNISLYDSHGAQGGQNPLDNKIILSLVNLQEEATLKNQPYFKKYELDTEYENPPVFINLFLLFSITTSNYKNALIYLSHIIGFFQGKRIFTNKNTPIPIVNPKIEDMEDFRLIMDLYSPTFEESNYLWSSLGGKLFPSALYKLRIVSLKKQQTQETRKTIQEIQYVDKSL